MREIFPRPRHHHSMKNPHLVRFIRAGSLAALMLALISSTQAVPVQQFTTGTLTWDNGLTPAWAAVSGGPYTGMWSAANDAVFEGSAGTVTIPVTGAHASNISFNSSDFLIQSRTLTIGETNPNPNATSVIHTGTGLSATINSILAGANTYTNVDVEGGGTLNLGGVETLTCQVIVGDTTAGNTLNIANGGKFISTIAPFTSSPVRQLRIGASTFGNNSMTISTPGTAIAPSFDVYGNGAQLNMGVFSSYNSLTVNNGAYVAQTLGAGTNTWFMGTNAGANHNTITVTGTGSSIVFGSNQAMVVGLAGSYNNVTVSAGGYFNAKRLVVGDGGGSNNSTVLTGSGSTMAGSGGTNAVFEIGAGSGANNNHLSITDGGVYTFSGSGTTRNFSIGGKGTQNSGPPISNTTGGDNNYMEISGGHSAFMLTFFLPVGVGGTVTGGAPGTVTDGGTGNHVDVFDGGLFDLGASASMYVMGTNSAVNVGNGTVTGTLKVGATTGFTAGLSLRNADGRLNFNGGRLVARANGALVSGHASALVMLNGPAYFSTTQAGSTLTTAINGTGAFTKEGSGTLSLSAANNYSGTTTVVGGTLVADTATNASVLNAASALALGDGGAFKLKGAATVASSQTLAGLTLHSGGNGVEVDNNGGTSTTLDLSGSGGTSGITRNPGGTVDFKASSGSTLGSDALIKTAQSNDGAGILGAWATVNGGADLATNGGASGIVAYAAYTNVTTFLIDGTHSNCRINTGSASILLSGAMTNINSLMQNSPADSTISINNNTLRLGTSGGISISPSGANLTIGDIGNPGTLTAGGNATDVAGDIVLGNVSFNTLTVNSLITNNGNAAVSLTKAGSGGVTLNHTNSYSGGTYVGGSGTLICGANNAIGSGPLTISGGILDLAGFTASVGAVTLTAGSITNGQITSSSGFTVNSCETTSIAAVLAGSVGLVKSGPGTATLSAANTYTGNTTVNEGTLVVSTAFFDDASTINVAAGGTINLASGVADTVDKLYIGGAQMLAGTHGSLTSTATYKHIVFLGSGTLNVLTGPPSLILGASPSTFAEDAGPTAATGTVTIPVALGTDLVVNLASNDLTEATVPATVTILAGNTSATFPIAAVTDALVDGSQAVTLTATATNYLNGTTGLTVTDVAVGGYAGWKVNNALGQGPTLDADYDGVPNGIEYFMGATGYTFTPTPSVVSGKVTWPRDPLATGVSYRVLTSPDLSVWTHVTLGVDVSNPAFVKYTLPTGQAKVFVRLEVTVAP